MSFLESRPSLLLLDTVGYFPPIAFAGHGDGSHSYRTRICAPTALRTDLRLFAHLPTPSNTSD
jgi:hypothetical protein